MSEFSILILRLVISDIREPLSLAGKKKKTCWYMDRGKHRILLIRIIKEMYPLLTSRRERRESVWRDIHAKVEKVSKYVRKKKVKKKKNNNNNNAIYIKFLIFLSMSY